MEEEIEKDIDNEFQGSKFLTIVKDKYEQI